MHLFDVGEHRPLKILLGQSHAQNLLGYIALVNGVSLRLAQAVQCSLRILWNRIVVETDDGLSILA